MKNKSCKKLNKNPDSKNQIKKTNNRQKGVALPSVVVLMGVVICFSLMITTLVVTSNLSIRYQQKVLARQIEIGKMYQDFVDDGIVSEDFDFDIEIAVNQDNENQKALVVKKDDAGNLDFYYLCIYDFENQKVLANQTEMFSVTIKNVSGEEYYFLADLIKYKKISS